MSDHHSELLPSALEPAGDPLEIPAGVSAERLELLLSGAGRPSSDTERLAYARAIQAESVGRVLERLGERRQQRRTERERLELSERRSGRERRRLGRY